MTAAKIFALFGSEDKKKYVARTQTPSFIQAFPSIYLYYTSSIPSLDAKIIHNLPHHSSHLAFTLICALPKIGQIVPLYLNKFILIRIA